MRTVAEAEVASKFENRYEFDDTEQQQIVDIYAETTIFDVASNNSGSWDRLCRL